MVSLRRDQLGLLLILLVAALLRVHHLGQIEHNVDQAYPIWQALNTLEHGACRWSARGPRCCSPTRP